MSTTLVSTPRLADHAQIIAAGSMLLLKSPRGVLRIQSPLLGDRAETLLSLLDGTRDRRALCRCLGLPRAELDQILAVLTEHDLLATGPPRRSSASPRRLRIRGPAPGAVATPARHGEPPPARPGEPPPEPPAVLLAGLGDLGTRVLRLLIAHGARLHLLDPEPVDAADAGTLYRRRDLGAPRVDAALACMDASARRRVVPVRPAAGCEADIAALAPALAQVAVAIACLDRPSWMLDVLAHACRQHGRPLVLAALHDHGASVAWFAGAAPDAAPDAAPRLGCAVCLRMHEEDRDPFARQLAPYLRARFPRAVPWRHPWNELGLDLTAHLAATQAMAMAHAPRPQARRLLIDRATMQHTEHDVPPHPRCQQCFPAPHRSPARLRRAAGRGFHGRVADPVPLPQLLDRLRGQVGRHAGIVLEVHQVGAQKRQALYRFVRRRGMDPRSSAIANMHQATAVAVHSSAHGMHRDVGEGSDVTDERAAEAIAIIEALERYFTMRHADPGRIVHASHAQLGDDALDPRAATLFAPHQYEQPGFRARRFSPDEPMAWMWGVRLRDRRPLLVPTALFHHQGASITPVNSSGAACHSSLHHAILAGVRETVERDALMLAWLHRLSLPRLTLAAGDPDPHGLCAELDRLGFDLGLVDVTTDLDIPVVLGLLRDRHDPHFLITNVVTAGDPAQAMGKLARELVQFALRYLVDRRSLRGPLSRSRDPGQVQTLRDHLVFHQHRSKVEAAGFLLASRQRRTLAAMFARMPAHGSDARAALAHLVDVLAARGHDVIAVDCTHPLLRTLGLHAVKVLIPGLIPLYEGIHYPLASPRLRAAPLNPWPHPFW